MEPTEPRRTKQAFSFTKPLLDALPPAAAGKRDYYNDTKVRGLQIMVTDKGSKSFAVYRRIKGRPTRYTLGSFPDLTPELARRKAEAVLGRIALGEDIVQEDRKVESQGITLGDAFDRFIKIRGPRLKHSTINSYANFMQGPLANWKNRRLTEITKDQIGERHHVMSRDNGPARADGVMRFLRSLLNFANGEFELPDGTPLLPYNPVSRLSQTRAWNRPKRRTTVIRAAQLEPWFAAVLDLKADAARKGLIDSQGALIADYLILLVLTGLRRSEGAQLKWADVDLANRTLTVRDTKNHDDHTLPMSDYLLDILKARRTLAITDFVFPGPGKTGHINEPRPQMAKVVAASGVEFHLHDLRRTFATVAESLDIPHYALKRLLNHRSNDVTEGYVIRDVERLRKPMQDITNYILKCARLKASAEVVPFPASGS